MDKKHEVSIIYSESEEDCNKLSDLLKQFNLESLLEILTGAGITYRSLKYLCADDIKEVIANVALRAEFRSKLFFWKKQEFGIDDETFSPDSKDISKLLESSTLGKSILEYYGINSSLKPIHRDEIIRIIIEEVLYTDSVLMPKDLENITQKIITIFPTEKNYADYYYIRRKNKRNPSGKLYDKYRNSRSKRRKLEKLNVSSTISPPIEDNIDIDVDEKISVSLQTLLKRQCSNWTEVCDLWSKTYSLRRKEIKILSKEDFLKSWPKLLDARAPELINIDFKLLYNEKDLSLFSKWDKFKEKIIPYYKQYIHNNNGKSILSELETCNNIDATDYILAKLLNCVLPPTHRFKDQQGKNKRKITIADGMESFALRLVTINDYQNQINKHN